MMQSSPTGWNRLGSLLPTLLVLILISACADSDRGPNEVLGTDPSAGKGAFLEVSPDISAMATQGERITLSAAVKDSRGRIVQNAKVEYTSLDPAVAVVDGYGTVTGISEGVANIVARAGVAQDTAVVAVAAKRLEIGKASVAVYPGADTIDALGGTLSLRAIARDRNGRLVTNAGLTWVSKSPLRASVDGTGTVTALTSGVAIIEASIDGASDVAWVWTAPGGTASDLVISPPADTIPSVGGTTQLAATVYDANGVVVNNQPVSWSSLDGSVATVDAQGRVTAKSKGVARIRAASGAYADTARVTIAPTLPPASITVQPSTHTIPSVGGTVQLQATVLDALGNPVTSVPVTWTSQQPAIATVNNAGRVTGVAQGAATIQATAGSVSASALIQVGTTPQVGAPASIEFTPVDGLQIAYVPNLAVQVLVLDANGVENTTAPVTWKSLSPFNAVVTVKGGNGRLIDVQIAKEGEVHLVATAGNASDTVWYRITSAAAVPAKVVVTPAVDTIAKVGGTLQLSGQAQDQSGNVISGASIAWTSLDAAIASVDQTGKVTGLKTGVARIAATHNAFADTAYVHVAPTVIAPQVPSSLVLNPGSASLNGVGKTVTLAATVRDQNGSTISNPSVAWKSLQPTIATVSGGVVTSVAAGTAKIVATAGNAADTAAVTVNVASNPVPVTLTVVHSPSNPSANSTVTFTATASPSGAVVSTRISVDGSVMKTCNAATCSWSTSFASGTHSYSASAVDTTGKTVNAGPNTFSIAVVPPPGAYSPTSPHWRHMRTSTIDYRIHYQGNKAAAEYDWAAGHFDHVVGGNVDQYKQRNPTMKSFVYDLFYGDEISDVGAFENWLTANGYNVEDAYLHKAGGSKTKADRIQYFQWTEDYYAFNLKDPGFQAWRKQRTQNLVGTRPSGFRFDGLFLDVLSSGGIQKAVPFVTLEYGSHNEYYSDLRGLLATHRQLVPSGILNINAATYYNKAEDQANAAAAGGVMTEFANSPYYEQKWGVIDALVSQGITVEYATGVKSNGKDKPLYDMNRGNYNSVGERVLMWEYASYLMVVNPNAMDAVLFEPYGANWDVPMSAAWLDAFEYDIGLATDQRRVLASGTDGAGQFYQVASREFENALVLIRARMGSGTTKFGDQTAEPVNLPAGTWRMLLPNGSITGPMTSIQLRNGEAAIFVK